MVGRRMSRVRHLQSRKVRCSYCFGEILRNGIRNMAKRNESDWIGTLNDERSVRVWLYLGEKNGEDE